MHGGVTENGGFTGKIKNLIYYEDASGKNG